MAGTADASDQFASWELIQRDFPAIEEFADNSIYSLPPALIEAISSEISGFFDANQQRIERRLASVSGAGFFRRRPIFYPPVTKSAAAPSDISEDPVFESAHEAVDRVSREIYAEEILKRGGSTTDVESYMASQHEAARRIAWWQKGYAGWLVTSSIFHSERDAFRTRWDERIRKLGRFPSVPVSYLGEEPDAPPVEDLDFFAAYMDFYRRWGLESMASWDLPLPLEAALARPNLYSLEHLYEAGILVFVPWYAFRTKEVNLQQIAAEVKLLDAPVHLQSWLDGKPKNWGYDRLAHMLDLYVFLKLALERRYPEQVAGNTDRLDYAFAAVLYRDPCNSSERSNRAENIRKVRQEMNRRLASTAD